MVETIRKQAEPVGALTPHNDVVEGYLEYLSNYFELSDVSEALIKYVLSNYQLFEFFPGTSGEFSRFNESVNGKYSISGIKKAFYALVSQGCFQRAARGLYVLNASLFPTYTAHTNVMYVVQKIMPTKHTIKTMAMNPVEEGRGGSHIVVLSDSTYQVIKKDYPEVTSLFES